MCTYVCTFQLSASTSFFCALLRLTILRAVICTRPKGRKSPTSLFSCGGATCQSRPSVNVWFTARRTSARACLLTFPANCSFWTFFFQVLLKIARVLFIARHRSRGLEKSVSCWVEWTTRLCKAVVTDRREKSRRLFRNGVKMCDPLNVATFDSTTTELFRHLAQCSNETDLTRCATGSAFVANSVYCSLCLLVVFSALKSKSSYTKGENVWKNHQIGNALLSGQLSSPSGCFLPWQSVLSRFADELFFPRCLTHRPEHTGNVLMNLQQDIFHLSVISLKAVFPNFLDLRHPTAEKYNLRHKVESP